MESKILAHLQSIAKADGLVLVNAADLRKLLDENDLLYIQIQQLEEGYRDALQDLGLASANLMSLTVKVFESGHLTLDEAADFANLTPSSFLELARAFGVQTLSEVWCSCCARKDVPPDADCTCPASCPEAEDPGSCHHQAECKIASAGGPRCLYTCNRPSPGDLERIRALWSADREVDGGAS
jgi:hypothetical protein